MIQNSNSGNTNKKVDIRSKVIASQSTVPRKDKLDEAPITNKMKSFVVGFKGGDNGLDIPRVLL